MTENVSGGCCVVPEVELLEPEDERPAAELSTPLEEDVVPEVLPGTAPDPDAVPEPPLSLLAVAGELEFAGSEPVWAPPVAPADIAPSSEPHAATPRLKTAALHRKRLADAMSEDTPPAPGCSAMRLGLPSGGRWAANLAPCRPATR